MKKIATIVIRQPLERLPPIINLIDCLIILGYQINLICSESSVFLKEKYKESVNFKIIKCLPVSIPFLGKLWNWLYFRKKVFSLLEKDASIYSKDTILWIGSADAALPLMIMGGLSKYKYVFQCHELYDAFPLYIKRLRPIMQNAIINIGPESNRNAIYRSWYNLLETPITLPNKPNYHPLQRNLPIGDTTAKQIIENIKDKKILLYQGGIGRDRDLTPIAEAVEKLNDDWRLVLMGFKDSSDYIDNLLKKFSKTIYIPPISAPKHLEVTSWARIGIVSYSFIDLNHTFCAPNKTWEYTGFGIPLLGNNVPGIMNDIFKFNSGVSINLNSDIECIVSAILKIDKEYSIFSKNAFYFYESISINQIIESIVKKYNTKNKQWIRKER